MVIYRFYMWMGSFFTLILGTNLQMTMKMIDEVEVLDSACHHIPSIRFVIPFLSLLCSSSQSIRHLLRSVISIPSLLFLLLPSVPDM